MNEILNKIFAELEPFEKEILFMLIIAGTSKRKLVQDIYGEYHRKYYDQLCGIIKSIQLKIENRLNRYLSPEQRLSIMKELKKLLD